MEWKNYALLPFLLCAMYFKQGHSARVLRAQQEHVVEEESWKKNGDTNPWFYETPKEAVTWSPEDEKFRQEFFSKAKTKWDSEDEMAQKQANLQSKYGQVLIQKSHLTRDELETGGKAVQNYAIVSVGANGQQMIYPQQQLNQQYQTVGGNSQQMMSPQHQTHQQHQTFGGNGQQMLNPQHQTHQQHQTGAGNGQQMMNPQHQTHQQYQTQTGGDPMFQPVPKDYYKGKINEDPKIKEMLAQTYIPRTPPPPPQWRPHPPHQETPHYSGQPPPSLFPSDQTAPKSSFTSGQGQMYQHQTGGDPMFQPVPKDYYKDKINEDPKIKEMLAQTYIPKTPPPPPPPERKSHPPPAESPPYSLQPPPPSDQTAPGSSFTSSQGQARGRYSHRMDDPPAEIIYRDRWFDDDEMYDYYFGNGASTVSHSEFIIRWNCLTLIVMYFYSLYVKYLLTLGSS